MTPEIEQTLAVAQAQRRREGPLTPFIFDYYVRGLPRLTWTASNVDAADTYHLAGLIAMVVGADTVTVSLLRPLHILVLGATADDLQVYVAPYNPDDDLFAEPRPLLDPPPVVAMRPVQERLGRDPATLAGMRGDGFCMGVLAKAIATGTVALMPAADPLLTDIHARTGLMAAADPGWLHFMLEAVSGTILNERERKEAA